jgi:NADH-quinone oxidoreductase subunit F
MHTLLLLNKSMAGKGTFGDLGIRVSLSDTIQKTPLYGPGKSVPNPGLITLRYLRDEY